LQSLQSEPYRFGFNAALRKLEAIHGDKPRLGESSRASDDAIRLGQEPSLAFAPTSLANFQPGSGQAPGRLNSFFFGLFGPNGPMPLHVTEYARSRELNEADPTFRRFADIFHHRFLCFLYRAWANGEPTVNMDRPDENRFDLFVGALFGLGGQSFRGRDAMPDAAKLFRSGRFALQTRPAEGLRAVLEDYFLLPFAVCQFVGEWLSIADEDRFLLGRRRDSSTMGIGAILGRNIWNCQHKFRIVAGPIGLKQFRRLLPGAESVSALVAIVRNYVGDSFAWDLQLILKKDEVPGIVLGSAGELGWTTWLGVRHQNSDAHDVVISPQLADVA
jgi:type VI secretion system protein ImpH